MPYTAELPPPQGEPAALTQARLPWRGVGLRVTNTAAPGLLSRDRLCSVDSIWVFHYKRRGEMALLPIFPKAVLNNNSKSNKSA